MSSDSTFRCKGKLCDNIMNSRSVSCWLCRSLLSRWILTRSFCIFSLTGSLLLILFFCSSWGWLFSFSSYRTLTLPISQIAIWTKTVLIYSKKISFIKMKDDGVINTFIVCSIREGQQTWQDKWGQKRDEKRPLHILVGVLLTLFLPYWSLKEWWSNKSAIDWGRSSRAAPIFILWQASKRPSSSSQRRFQKMLAGESSLTLFIWSFHSRNFRYSKLSFGR